MELGKGDLKIQYKLELEKGFDEIFRLSCENNPFANSPLEAMHSYTSIAEASTTFKKEGLKIKEVLKMTATEIDDVVEEVTSKVLKKYFDNF